MNKKKILCPSHRCEEGSILLGIVNSEGIIEFINDTLYINKSFVDKAKTGKKPEKRFRFANLCITKGCMQWTGRDCGLITNIMNYVENKNLLSPKLTKCTIRAECRWFIEHGSTACKVCPIVITE